MIQRMCDERAFAVISLSNGKKDQNADERSPLALLRLGLELGTCWFVSRQLRISSIMGPIAQSVEQRTFNPWVDGSSPSGPTF
jgi:hypothetical protein